MFFFGRLPLSKGGRKKTSTFNGTYPLLGGGSTPPTAKKVDYFLQHVKITRHAMKTFFIKTIFCIVYPV